jgi:hypothetical protein
MTRTAVEVREAILVWEEETAYIEVGDALLEEELDIANDRN